MVNFVDCFILIILYTKFVWLIFGAMAGADEELPIPTSYLFFSNFHLPACSQELPGRESHPGYLCVFLLSQR